VRPAPLCKHTGLCKTLGASRGMFFGGLFRRFIITRTLRKLLLHEMLLYSTHTVRQYWYFPQKYIYILFHRGLPPVRRAGFSISPRQTPSASSRPPAEAPKPSKARAGDDDESVAADDRPQLPLRCSAASWCGCVSSTGSSKQCGTLHTSSG